MYPDISRDSFNPARHHLRVVQEQGRVLIDAEANEQTAILLYRLHALAQDLLGYHWGPAETRGTAPNEYIDTGFRIGKDPEHKSLTIGPGRYYVGGVLAESDGADYFDQPFLNLDPTADALPPAPFLVYLDVSEGFLPPVGDPELTDEAFERVGASPRGRVVWQVRARPLTPDELRQVKPDNNQVDLSKLTRGVLEGWLGVARPKPPPGLRAAPVPGGPADRPYLGGENQLYRLEIHQAGGSASPGVAAGGTVATFKWARDNAAAVFGVRELTGAGGTYQVVLSGAGVDDRFALQPEEWVEYVDDDVPRARWDGGLPGKAAHLFRVVEVDPFDPTLIQIQRFGKQAGPDLPNFGETNPPGSLHPFMRRWDHPFAPPGESLDLGRYPGQTASRVGVPVADDGTLTVLADPDATKALWIDLEDGVRVRFSPSSDYRRGDNWLIPARAGSEAVLWPSANGTDPDEVPPLSPPHAYAPLALVVTAADAPTDCRRMSKAEALTMPPPAPPPAPPRP